MLPSMGTPLAFAAPMPKVLLLSPARPAPLPIVSPPTSRPLTLWSPAVFLTDGPEVLTPAYAEDIPEKRRARGRAIAIHAPTFAPCAPPRCYHFGQFTRFGP